MKFTTLLTCASFDSYGLFYGQDHKNLSLTKDSVKP